jgi:predicted nucleic acid-binding protein
MRVIVDTCVWSLALRRNSGSSEVVHRNLQSLIVENRLVLIGPIRQELLSGIHQRKQFESVAEKLSSFSNFMIEKEDYVLAAELFNSCRSKGVQGSHVDFLISAGAIHHKMEIYSFDKDFIHYEKYIPIKLYAEN